MVLCIPLRPIDKGFIARVDSKDFWRLADFQWRAMTNRRNGKTYAFRNWKDENGKRRFVLMHHEILPLRKDRDVDHIDGDTLNNTRSNLRYATRSQNRANSKKNSHAGGKATTSRFKGVGRGWWGEKWSSVLTVNGNHMRLGYFDSEEEAARAYDKAAREHFGEFARLNFPDEQPAAQAAPVATVAAPPE